MASAKKKSRAKKSAPKYAHAWLDPAVRKRSERLMKQLSRHRRPKKSAHKKKSASKKKSRVVQKSRSKFVETVKIGPKSYTVHTGSNAKGKMIKYVKKMVRKGRSKVAGVVKLTEKQLKRIVSIKRK